MFAYAVCCFAIAFVCALAIVDALGVAVLCGAQGAAIILSSYECAEFSFSLNAFPNECGANAWQFEWNRCTRNESAVRIQQAYHYRNFIFMKNLFV